MAAILKRMINYRFKIVPPYKLEYGTIAYLI